nr:unnamed protein product [Digitaria exilis]
MVIASGAVDRRHLSPFATLSESSSSSFFSEDLVPAERQVGFWKTESTVDHRGSKSAIASPLDKVHPMGANPTGGLEHARGQAFNGQLDMLSLSNLMGQEENASSLPSISWGDILGSSRSGLGSSTRGTASVEPTSADQRVHDYGSYFSSSSVSEVFSSKSRMMADGVPSQPADASSTGCEGDEPLVSMKEMEAQTIGDLLPDDDELISGITDGFECTGLSNHDDADEDIFYTGGGLELENDDTSNGDKFHEGSLESQLSGKHSIYEHPSRTLIIKNISPIIEDSELRVQLQQYGDIQALHTSFKNHGFVTVSYYDIRAAQNAMRVLHNKTLGLMNLDVQFSITKENKDPNNGILAVSIIDSSISSHDLLRIFSVYGDVKEIFKAPTSYNKNFVEYYDIRAAELALNKLNNSDMSCSKIKVEHSRSGGAGLCFTEQCSGEWKQNTVTHQLKNSPPGTIESENKKQFELDLDRIAKGEDSRTTLMIKNIPNKYNCKLLLAVIDENHRGTYDFIYLPIDFKNKCNVGYAFINMTDPQHIIPFYKVYGYVIMTY